MAGTSVDKCTELRTTVDLTRLPPELSGDLGKLRLRLQEAIDATQPQDLKLTVRPIHSAAGHDRATVRVEAEGRQDAMEPFGTWARRALRAALDKMLADVGPRVDHGPAPTPGPRPRRAVFGRIERVENDEGEDEITRIELPGPSGEAIRAMMAAIPRGFILPGVTAPSIKDVALTAVKPEPSGEPYHGCTARASEGDHELNSRKNRTDSAPWNLVSISSILDLEYPANLPASRNKWSPEQAAKVAQFEGTPVQVAGWLADINKEGSEDCNCSSCDDVDYHLWVVDRADKTSDKSQALVAEVTPRISKDKSASIASGISAAKTSSGLRQIRVSGWLMLDQKHIGQAGRRTAWEIHPIIKFEIQDPNDGSWTTLFEPAQ